ncbi:MAG: glycosyltransferase [Acidimicrobiales bacterium]|nr:glycosyltransferase [Acidimicrobiales bacterium]
MEALEGGTARHLVDIATHADEAQHHVVVPAARVGGLTDETAVPCLRAAGAQVHLLRMHRAPWSPVNVLALRRVRRLLQTVRPDIVHGHSSIGGLLARVATIGTDLPVVYTANGITGVRAGVAVERVLGRRTTRFVATSASEAELAVQLGLASPTQVAVIPNGIELEIPAAPIDLRAVLDVPPEAPLVGTIARLVPQKAPEDFVAACAVVAGLVPSVRFVMVGGGEQEALYESAVDAAGLRGQLHRIPSLAGAAGVLGQLDVFALSSRFEGGPYAPLEAMRAGTPVVLTDVVGSRDAVEHGVSGRLVPPGDPLALGQAVADLLLNPVERRRLGEGGRARVASQFDVRSMGASLTELYGALAEGRPGR